MHSYVRTGLRITLIALAVFSMSVGIIHLANGVELAREADGRVRPSMAIINVVFGATLLAFTIPSKWWPRS